MKITRQGDEVVVRFSFPQGDYSYCRDGNGDWHYRPQHLGRWIELKASLVPASVLLRVQRFLQTEPGEGGERKAS